MRRLHISIESRNKLWIKYTDYGIRITAREQLGELDGQIDLTWIDTKKDQGFMRINFTDSNPWISVYETDGETVLLGFGTSLDEGIHASIKMDAENAEELIRKIQKQLDKKIQSSNRRVKK